jgi:Peptidase A4 family
VAIDGHLEREAISMHRRFTSFAAHVLVACVPALGLAAAVGAGTASAARSPVNARAAALAALQHLKIGEHATDQPLPGQSVRVKGATTSGNWAGYADTKTSGKYTKITGSWTEPKGTCGSSESLAVFWTGIDGFNSSTVEQDGTLIDCEGGTPTYFSWWEMFPSNTIQAVSSAVRPGDHVVSSVTRSGTKYTLKLTDSTHPAASFSTTQSCAAATCVDSSAEWIAEAPSNSSGILPLTNFGSWTLTGATVKAGTKSGTIKTFPNQKITMANGSGQVKAQPGALNAAGNQFKVTWKRST